MILNMDDWRAALIIQTPKTQRVHLVPVSFFEDVAEEKRKITDLDDWESITEIIITEWLRARKEAAKQTGRRGTGSRQQRRDARRKGDGMKQETIDEIERLTARVAEQEVCRNKTCTWKPYREHRKKDNMLKTSCGYVSCNSERYGKYCPYCGGKIEEDES